jgi:hypothetical protein
MKDEIKKQVEAAKIIVKEGECMSVDGNDCWACIGCIEYPLTDRDPAFHAAIHAFIAKHEGPDIEALLKSHREIVGEKADEVRYFLCMDYLSVMKFTGRTLSHIKEQGSSFVGGVHGRSIQYLRAKYPETTYIEVTERDLPYLVKPDVAIYGETEFRKVVKGDMRVGYKVSGHGELMEATLGVYQRLLSGYRWCIPRAKVCESCGQEI